MTCTSCEVLYDGSEKVFVGPLVVDYPCGGDALGSNSNWSSQSLMVLYSTAAAQRPCPSESQQPLDAYSASRTTCLERLPSTICCDLSTDFRTKLTYQVQQQIGNCSITIQRTRVLLFEASKPVYALLDLINSILRRL